MIEYESSSFDAPFSQDELDSFARMMLADSPDFEYDASYVEHMQRFNGGQPKHRLAELENGDSLYVDVILNFADPRISPPLVRQTNVQQVWNLIEDRLPIGVFPFAATAGGDFVCFDHRQPGRPRVVLWLHEKASEDEPHVEFVAATFDDFVKKLRH